MLAIPQMLAVVIGSLIDLFADRGTGGTPFRAKRKGVEMMSLGRMSLEHPPVYNPQFTPAPSGRDRRDH
jgi:hypothetical protein